MAIDSARYHGWRGDLQSPWIGCLALVRVSLLQVFRRKAYWLVLALGTLQFLLFWIVIYLINQPGILNNFKDQVLKALSFDVEAQPGQENGYVAFMYQQSIVVMILLAFSGSLLVGHDFRFRALPFYLSRRIDRRHYIVGKLLAVSALIALLTILPALLLFFEYGMFTGSLDYWTRNWQIPISVLGYGAVTCGVMSIGIVTLSAYLQRMAPIAITWASLFVLLSRLAELLNDRTPYWNLIDPWRDMRYVGRLCFGTFSNETDRELAWYALWILSGVCTVALAALVHRVRAVDIVE
jgi:ABC-type transport system involved in multi-copper enzyme maturation permease subunit